MTAVDTNILVYAHRPDCPFHDRAVSAVASLAEGREPWAIPWPVIHEFLAIVSNPRIFATPTPIRDAVLQIGFWSASPGLRLIGEGPGYLSILTGLLERGRVSGPRVHDARIAAICLANGVSRLLSADRDFSRFADALPILNPL
ncbi:MAG: PIN domain-containing protein [Fimbriimonadaceae bacterium]|nr:PIN domain-containing protein [Fimbriimonadaceae bacterium]